MATKQAREMEGTVTSYNKFDTLGDVTDKYRYDSVKESEKRESTSSDKWAMRWRHHMGQQEKRQEFIPTIILYGPSTLADRIFQGTPLPPWNQEQSTKFTWYKRIFITWKPPTSSSNAMNIKAHPKLTLTIPSTTPDSYTGLKQESIVEYGCEEEIYLKIFDAIIQIIGSSKTKNAK
ncbi:hypothetical protein DAPPUDRAFT_119247 [Daphnia pulex]|uniref:Uncharacterized protein n=1 Tax=Daphnia pulex TaxID=6669 RepID=E9HXX6_DAPPU|nr:hypothetical protein DAPPUDRAFT_119247 [Daphnia pulex]|eukprot:EFX63402.1 hypothetical protein DAPPUDRAFT_119247 [Daphnia pulex]